MSKINSILATVMLMSLLGADCDPAQSPCDRPGVICTVAGNGESIFNGDGHPALETGLYFPLDIEFEPGGRPLILDFNNIRIRAINADNTIETIIGQDFEDAPEEGSLAKDAPLHHPSDIEYDSKGILLIAGDHVPLVIAIDTNSRVQILAGSDDFGNDGDGGPARSARMTAPFGVVPNANGGFYVADIDAHVVRYVDANRIISTVAGTGAPGYSGDDGSATDAQLNGPTRLRITPEGELLICDTDNHAIRKIGSDGKITTIAGTGIQGFSGDNGPATSAMLSSPYDLRFAPNGDLFIADSGNHVIRRVDATGKITTAVGMPESSGFIGDASDASGCKLNVPSGINFDASGNLWIADAYNHRVRRITSFLTWAGAE
ncbi:MAG: hypothetical protein IPK83_24410 [Planctomycetes bacterium]|nr:hypothetical protein [Planctomycetota bacterium]